MNTPDSYPSKRVYEGPARLHQEATWDDNLRDPRGMPGHLSVSDHLNREYGPEGTGWEFVTDRYADQNELKNVLHGAEFDVATAAFNNWILHGRYEVDGEDMTGKVQRYVREPDQGDVVIYPDGDVYKSESQNKSQ